MYKEYIEKIAAKDYSDLARRMRAENVANLYDSGASQHVERIRKARQANQAKINTSNKAQTQQAIEGLKGIRGEGNSIPQITPSLKQSPSQQAIEGLKGIRNDIVGNNTVPNKVKPAPSSVLGNNITPKVKPSPNLTQQTQTQQALNGLKGIRNDIAGNKTAPASSPSTLKDLVDNARKTQGQSTQKHNLLTPGKEIPYKTGVGDKVKNLWANKNIRRGAIGTAIAAGTAYGIYRNSKKNKEKTAYDIVVDAFEKIALEEQ